MAGVLEGVEVLDLSWGSPGRSPGCCSPITAHGSRRSSRRVVTRPAASPVRGSGTGEAERVPRPEERRRPRSGARVARRHHPRELLAGRHQRSSASTTTRCSRINPRLVYRSITAYGDDDKHSDRPRLRGARRGAHRPAMGEPRRPGRHLARLSGFEAARYPASRCPTTVGPRAAPGPALFAACRGRAWPPRTSPHSRQCGAARARADRTRSARRDVTAPGRARDNASAAGRRSSASTPRTSRAG